MIRNSAPSRNSCRKPLSIRGFLEGARGFLEGARRGSPRVRITGRRLCVWISVSILVAGLHLCFFDRAFRETWYAPLHFLWVVVGACGVSWWCLRPGARRRIALLQAATFVAVSCGITWAVARVPWGGWIAGEARLPPAGGLLVLASVSLVVGPAFIALAGSPVGVFQSLLRQNLLRQKGER